MIAIPKKMGRTPSNKAWFKPHFVGRCTLFLFLFFFAAANGQVAPICDSPANGSDWKLIGPNNLPELGPGARFSQLGTGAQMRIQFQDPNSVSPKVLYTCTPTGGLFRTMDATAEKPIWENVTDSTRLPVLGVRDMAFVPNSKTIYAGTGIRYPLELRRLYGIGILKSTNNGKNWQATGLQFTPPGQRDQICHDLLVHPLDTNVVHAVCGPNYYKSINGGENFNLKLTHDLKCPAGWGASFRDIAFKPDNPNVVYLSSDHNFFYLSNDKGESWDTLNVKELGVKGSTYRMDIAVSHLNHNLVFLACATTENETILRSTNAGKDWEIVFEKRLRTSYERNDLIVSPNDTNVLYIGGIYLDQITLDSTKSNARNISSGTHPDHRGLLAISDGNGNDILFSANDGGLYRGHLPSGKKRWEWKDISGTGMNNTQFYGIAVAEDYSVILGGTQDNGLLVRDSFGRFYKPRLGGDASDCAVDRFDPTIVYGTKWDFVAPQVWRSVDSGGNFNKLINKGVTDKADTYYLPLETDENGNLYFGTRNVLRLPHKGEEWEQVGEINLPTSLPYRLLSIAICPSNPNAIYAIGDLVYKTTNATADSVIWEKISDGMGPASRPYGAGGELSCVTMDAQFPERVWVGVRNYDSPNKVYFSENGGETWTVVSSGLPPFPVNDIAFQAGTEDAVYVGTDVGVFYNPNASNPASEWQCFNNNLPVCLVNDLEMNYCFGKIVVGTFGRGIWESPFADASAFPTIEVEKNVTWSHKILRSDVELKKDAILTLKGEVRLATGKKIILSRNSRLVLDGAHLDALCGEKWGGIEIKDDLNFFQRLFGARPGVLEILNGASIENQSDNLP